MTSFAVPDPVARRRRLANSFGQAAESYDRFRPAYPADAVAAAVDSAHRVLDLEAGTGKLTRRNPGGRSRALDATVRPHGGATGQTAPPDSVPEAPFTGNAHFADPALQLIDWNHRMTGDELHGLADTYSYVLTAEPSSRAALHRQLDELIDMRSDVAIAERCQVWTAVRV